MLLFIFLSVCYFSFGTYKNWPYKIESDGKYYYQYLVAGYYNHNFDFTNTYRASKYPWMRTEIDHYNFRGAVNPRTGRPMNQATIGPAILWTPFFLTAKAIADFLNKFGLQIDVNPWGLYFQYTVMFSAVIYTMMALYFLYRLLTLYFPEKISMGGIGLILFATNLFYYAVFEVSMTHVYDLFTYVAYLFLFVKCIKSNRLIFYVGLAITGTLHILVRTQNIATIGLFSVLLLVIPLVSQRKYPPLNLIVTYGIILFIGILPIPLVNNYLAGRPFYVPQGDAFFCNLTNPHFLWVLFSPRNGLFSHHPILLPGLVGFIWFLVAVIFRRKFPDNSHLTMSGKEARLFFGTMFTAFVIQLYINSSNVDWHGGDAFGQRRFVSSFPLFAFGLAYIMQRIEGWCPILNILGIIIFSVLGLYLTYIHVFLWNYSEPHNIIAWMFWIAPQMLFFKVYWCHMLCSGVSVQPIL